VLGVTTNILRLQAVVDHPAFRRGDLHTGFLDEHLAEVTPSACPPPEALAAALAALQLRPTGVEAPVAAAPDPWSALGERRLP
jgi:acetyl/propionyl-CoA carboxylase alpha subunit